MKQIVIGIVVGCVATLLIGWLIGYLAITNGWLPARGDEPSGQFETWAAHKALKAVLQRDAQEQSPLPADEKNLLAGVKLYSENCSGCHGAPKNPTPAFAKGFNPNPPLFANGDMVTDDPEGHIYWIIDHGIKFTGMPAFNTMLKKDEMWQMALFLKHMDKLPPKAAAMWKDMK